MDNKCIICNSEVNRCKSSISLYNISCFRCGQYIITDDAVDFLRGRQLSPAQIANISGWIRENKGCRIFSEDVERLLRIETPSPAEKADKLLVYLSKQYPRPGQRFVLKFQDMEECLLYQAITYSVNMEEVYYFFRTYLDTAKHYLNTSDISTYVITPEGWAHIESRRQLNPESYIAFIAMWFDKSLDDLWKKGIEPGVVDAGYKPDRIDKKEHLNKIDDEIIAGIRKSRFVVADFNYECGGVYFEAGYALGLGLPVVWLCERTLLDEKKIHFDIRQYNFIGWERDKWEELKKALANRIEAAIGHGPYKPA